MRNAICAPVPDSGPCAEHRTWVRGLFEGPCFASLPLQIAAVEVPSEYVARLSVEQVPGAHQVERGVGRADLTGVQDPGETACADQDVGGDEVRVAHLVGVFSGQFPELTPQASHGIGVDESLAAVTALIHPRVVGLDGSTAPFTPESPAPRVPFPKVPDEFGEVVCQVEGLLARGRGGGAPVQPGLETPRQRVPLASSPTNSGFGAGKGLARANSRATPPKCGRAGRPQALCMVH